MNTLIGLSERLDQLSVKEDNHSYFADKIVLEKAFKLNSFIKQTLKLYQFIPCNEVNGQWEVLEKPSKVVGIGSSKQSMMRKLKEYQEAEKRVIFKGFEYNQSHKIEIIIRKKGTYLEIACARNKGTKEWVFNLYKTIEDLTKLDLQLTKTGEQQAGYIN